MSLILLCRRRTSAAISRGMRDERSRTRSKQPSDPDYFVRGSFNGRSIISCLTEH